MIRRILTICLLYIPYVLQAQVYNVTPYKTADGLIQSQVRALLQDEKGYLWFGTHRGISKFDGQRFTNYTTKSYPELAGNFLTDLLQDQRGRIWIAANKGISRFDGRSFRSYGTAQGLPSPDIQSLLEDRDGRIWIGDASGNISIIEADTLIATPYEWQGAPEERLIHDMLEDRRGNVWIATNHGLFRWQGRYIEPFSPSGFPDQLEIFDLMEETNRDIWLGTANGSFRLSKAPSARADVAYEVQHFTERQGLPEQRVFCIVEDTTEKTIWFGTGRGIAYYQNGTITPIVRVDRTLDYQMRSAIIDHEGDIWFGTEGGGATKLTRGVFEKYDMGIGLSSNIAKSFLQDASGRIWISTYDQGVNILPRNTNMLNMQGSVQRPSMPGRDISYSYQDRKGHFWFCFYSGGLTRYDGRSFQYFDAKDGLEADATYCVTENAKGVIWVGTSQGIYEFTENRFKPLTYDPDRNGEETIYTLKSDSRDRMWIGSAQGLSILEEGVLRREDSIGDGVISILEDAADRMWIASSAGLSVYDPEVDSFEFVRISGAEGAEVVVSFTLEPTPNTDFLWIGTENGAYRLDLNTYQRGKRPTFEHYTQKDGLPSLECNANAAFTDANGDVWIGTAEGAIRKPAGTERKDTVVAPKVYITDVKASSDSTWQQLGYEIDRETGLPNDLILPYTENTLNFRFIGVSLKSPGQIEYKHRLIGADARDWSNIRSTRGTSFSIANLTPGTYTFEVIAKKESEKWDQRNKASFDFIIQRPYWETWWFRALMLLIFVGIVYGIYQNITSRRRQKQREQMMKNQAEKLALEHQALYAMMNPHFTFNALQSIQYYIHRQDKIAANKFLSSFAKLIRKNLESTKSEFISLREEVDRLGLYLSLEKMRFHEKFEYEVRVEPEVDEHNTLLPPMILQPFVENSIKHGIMPLEGEGKVSVHISILDEDHLQVLIRDNGIGVEASRKQRANRPNDHVSKGMQITTERLKLFANMTETTHSLDIDEIRDEAGKVAGTQVKMVLPLYM